MRARTESTISSVSLFLTAIMTIATAALAYATWRSVEVSAELVQITKKATQADLLEKLEARWNSTRMISVRSKLAREAHKGELSAKKTPLDLKQILDYFDLVGEYAKDNTIEMQHVDDLLGYYIWEYAQVWQDQIAQVETEQNLEWPNFHYLVDWISKNDPQDNLTPQEKMQFIDEEKNLVK